MSKDSLGLDRTITIEVSPFELGLITGALSLAKSVHNGKEVDKVLWKHLMDATRPIYKISNRKPEGKQE